SSGRHSDAVPIPAIYVKYRERFAYAEYMSGKNVSIGLTYVHDKRPALSHLAVPVGALNRWA
ncbi:hypothetical protein Q6322_26615, partial [Klebsiella pneumoniae]|nr:hypothetical protein [Klebsiella pneumoniae]